jgi:hypothetical protein
VQHLPEDVLFDFQQILPGEHSLDLLHVLLPVLLVLQRTQYLEVQLAIDPFRPVVFLHLLFVALKLLKNL